MKKGNELSHKKGGEQRKRKGTIYNLLVDTTYYVVLVPYSFHILSSAMLLIRTIVCLVGCWLSTALHVRMGPFMLLWGEALRPPPNPPHPLVLFKN